MTIKEELKDAGRRHIEAMERNDRDEVEKQFQRIRRLLRKLARQIEPTRATTNVKEVGL